MKKLYKIIINKADMVSKPSLEEQLAEDENTELNEKAREKDKELGILIQRLPIQARAQYVNEIKKENENVAGNIAAAETLFN